MQDDLFKTEIFDKLDELTDEQLGTLGICTYRLYIKRQLGRVGRAVPDVSTASTERTVAQQGAIDAARGDVLSQHAPDATQAVPAVHVSAELPDGTPIASWTTDARGRHVPDPPHPAGERSRG